MKSKKILVVSSLVLFAGLAALLAMVGFAAIDSPPASVESENAALSPEVVLTSEGEASGGELITFFTRDDNSHPTSRNALDWPFAPWSIWNMPIHNNAQYAPARIKSGAENIRKLATDQDILVLTPDAPLTDIHESTVGWGSGVNGQARCAGVTDQVHRRLPIDSSFFTVGLTSSQDPEGRDGTTGNHATSVLAQDGRTLYSFGPGERCADGTAGQYGAPMVARNHPIADDAITDIRTGVGRRGNHGGSGLSSIGGTLRVGELAPGQTIRHVLKINLWGHENLCSKASVNDGDQFVWPARTADGYADIPNDRGPGSPDRSYQGANPDLCMGSLIALRPDFDVDNLRSDAGKILATALQNYGAYIVDDTTRDVYGLATEWGPAGNARLQFEEDWGYPIDTTDQNHPWLLDLHTIFEELNVITNQNESNIGGGPTSDDVNRRAPQAPPFS